MRSGTCVVMATCAVVPLIFLGAAGMAGEEALTNRDGQVIQFKNALPGQTLSGPELRAKAKRILDELKEARSRRHPNLRLYRSRAGRP